MIAKYNHLIKKTPEIFYPVVKRVLKHSFGSLEPTSMYNVNAAIEIKKM